MENGALGQTAVISDVSLIQGIFDLKAAAVLFDRVIVLHTPEWQYRNCAGQRKLTIEQTDPEFDRMYGDGFIELRRYGVPDEFVERNPSYADRMRWLENRACNLLLSTKHEARRMLVETGDWRARAVAASLGGTLSNAHIPVLLAQPLADQSDEPDDSQNAISYASAVQFLLRDFPVPSPTAPWNKIKLFRADQACCGAFRVLRKWLSDSVKVSSDYRELEDKLYIEIRDYQKRLEQHKLKSTLSLMEACLVAAVDLGPLLLKLQWGEVVKNFFEIANAKVKVMEEEIALAREGPAYLWKASSTLK